MRKIKIKLFAFAVLLALLITGCEKEQLNYIEQGVEVNEGSSQSEPITSVEGSSIIDDDEEKLSDYETSSADYTEGSDAPMMSEEEKNDYRIPTKEIIEENKEIIIEFLESYPARDGYKCYMIYYFDFTQDGEREIILSRGLVVDPGTVYYNYVYDVSGNLLFEYLSMGKGEIYSDEDTGKFYLVGDCQISNRHFLNIYVEINIGDGMDANVMFVEWEIHNRDGNMESYQVMGQLSQEEVRRLGEGYGGMMEFLNSKKGQENIPGLEKYKEQIRGLKEVEQEYVGFLTIFDGDIFLIDTFYNEIFVCKA